MVEMKLGRKVRPGKRGRKPHEGDGGYDVYEIDPGLPGLRGQCAGRRRGVGGASPLQGRNSEPHRPRAERRWP